MFVEVSLRVTITLIAKRRFPKNYGFCRFGESQEFRIGVHNNSEKPAVGAAGEIKFVDVFDEEVGAVNFRNSENIAQWKSATWVGGRDYNQFPDEHRADWNLEEGKYTTKFLPDMVVFEDGNKLTMPKLPVGLSRPPMGPG